MIYETINLTQKCSVIILAKLILADEANQGGIVSKFDEGTFRTLCCSLMCTM